MVILNMARLSRRCLCLAMAVGPQLLGHGSFNYALRYMSPTFISLLVLLEPVVSSAVAYALFSEAPGAVAVLGMVLVLASVALAVLGRRLRRARRPDRAYRPE